MPEKMSTERAALDALLDASALAQIALLMHGRPVVFPTAFAVLEDQLVIHGSTGSRWMRALTEQEVTVGITKLEGIVVARSTFESSVWYRSAMVFGRFTSAAAADKVRLLHALSDRLIPGRSAEVRASTAKELAATAVLTMPIRQWSLRSSSDWPEDEPNDRAGDSWAGAVAFDAPRTRILPAPDLRAGIPVPASALALANRPERIV